jgi:hypothetical protein
MCDTGPAYQFGAGKILFPSVYVYPSRMWSDTNITKQLRFRNKTIFAGDLNAKQPFWSSAVSKDSEETLAIFQYK